MPLLPSQVSSAQAMRLNFANHIISKVRQRLSFGAGNQEVDHDATGGESSRRTNRVYWMYDLAMGQLDSSERNQKPRKPKLMAGIADKYGAGNCDMAAAMSFTILRELLDANWDVIWIAQSHHAYAGFKPKGSSNTEITVVDAWPTYGMATLLDDHFLGDIDHAAVSIKEGKRTEAISDRVTLNARWSALSALIDYDLGRRALNIQALGVDIYPMSESVYDQQLCSDTVSHYHTADGVVVPNPAQRLLMPAAPIPEDSDSDMSGDDSSVSSR